MYSIRSATPVFGLFLLGILCGLTPRGAVAAPVTDSIFTATTPPKPLPFLTLQNDKQRTISLTALVQEKAAGRTALILFWAPWCPPCVAEMPDLDAALANPAPDPVLIPIAIQTQGAVMLPIFFKRHGWAHIEPWWIESQDRLAAFGTTAGIPLALWLSPQGQEIGRLTGARAWLNPQITATPAP